MVGINPRTGKRWRHGRTVTSSSGRRLHYPPVITTRRQEISPRYLSEDERVTIADLRVRGLTVRAIAAELGRSPATVSRELRRNADPGSGQYRPFTAQRLAADRRARPGRGKLLRDPVLREFVAGRLKKRWSPEQISQALRVEFPGGPERHVVPETIYQAVYRPELGGLVRELPEALRTGRRRRKPHRRLVTGWFHTGRGAGPLPRKWNVTSSDAGASKQGPSVLRGSLGSRGDRLTGGQLLALLAQSEVADGSGEYPGSGRSGTRAASGQGGAPRSVDGGRDAQHPRRSRTGAVAVSGAVHHFVGSFR